jgi:hypothetical protein
MKNYSFQFQNKKGWVNLSQKAEVDSEQTLILAFCSPQFRDNPAVFAELSSFFPKAIIVGCSTSGEIFGEQIFDLTISCTAIRFESASLKQSFQTIENPSQSFDAGKTLAKALQKSDLRSIIVLSDGLLTNGSHLADGLNSVIDSKKVSISGGLAGDGNLFQSTWILHSGKVQSNTIVGVGLYGENLFVSTSSKGGWDIFGPERLITRSVDNVVYEIDGRPALDLYKEYLGERAKDLPSSGLLFPIQIRENSSMQKRLVRTILSVDEKTKALNFAGNVPTGFLVQLMRANFERVIDGAGEAAELVKTRMLDSLGAGAFESPSVCLALSCVGRRLVLGTRSEEEIELLKGSLGQNTSVIGFYSYGELASSQQNEPCDLHNQSMTLMHLYEMTAQQTQKVG